MIRTPCFPGSTSDRAVGRTPHAALPVEAHGASRFGYLLLLAAVVLWLAGCAQTPRGPVSGPDPVGGGDYRRDGPGRLSPQALANIPDAEPRVEAFRSGTLRPYTIRGRRYVPMTADGVLQQRGTASWYGRQFHGRPTASGEPFDMYAMTAAHPTMPLPSYARVRHLGNGHEVVVRVNDRGPFHAGRIIDLSYAAAARLGFIRQGSAQVEVERLTHTAIAQGTWRSSNSRMARRTPEPPPPAAARTAAVVATSATEASPAATVAAAAAAAAATVPAASASAISAAAESTPSASAPGTVPAAQPGQSATASALAALAEPISGYWLQLGAFRARDGAERFREQVAATVDWLAPWLSVFEDQPLYRLQAGPYVSRDQADQAATHVREALHLAPVVVER